MFIIKLVILSNQKTPKVVYDIPQMEFDDTTLNISGVDLSKVVFSEYVGCGVDWLTFKFVSCDILDGVPILTYTVLVPEIVELINKRWINISEVDINGGDAELIYRASLVC